MNKGVYIFIGQSGCGKGTQVELLKKKIQSIDPSASMFDLETGKIFRELISEHTFTGKKTKEMIDEGKLPPSFLGIHAWSHSIIENYNDDKHVFIDGTPRVSEEVPALFSVFDFFNWHPHVINLEVSDEWSYDRLKARGREDDKDENDVWSRIQWFHESVVPAIELLKQSARINYHCISGEQTIEAVHRDICIALNLE